MSVKFRTYLIAPVIDFNIVPVHVNVLIGIVKDGSCGEVRERDTAMTEQDLAHYGGQEGLKR